MPRSPETMPDRPPSLIQALLEGLPAEGWLEIRLYRGRLAPGPNWRLTRRMKNHILYLIADGRGRFRCGDTELDVQAPSALLLAKGAAYTLGSDRRAPLIFYPVHFLRLRRGGKESPLPSGTPAWQVMDAALPPGLISALESMHTLWCSGAPTAREGAAAGLHSLLAQLAAPLHVAGPSLSRKQLRIQQVCAFIDRDPGRRLPLSELARMAGMSRSSFSQHFKELTGLSPLRYAIRQRCRHAVGLMRDEGFRVGEAAAATGYADAFSFSKQFRAVMGYPPSHVRARVGSRLARMSEKCMEARQAVLL